MPAKASTSQRTRQLFAKPKAATVTFKLGLQDYPTIVLLAVLLYYRDWLPIVTGAEPGSL